MAGHPILLERVRPASAHGHLLLYRTINTRRHTRSTPAFLVARCSLRYVRNDGCPGVFRHDVICYALSSADIRITLARPVVPPKLSSAGQSSTMTVHLGCSACLHSRRRCSGLRSYHPTPLTYILPWHTVDSPSGHRSVSSACMVWAYSEESS